MVGHACNSDCFVHELKKKATSRELCVHACVKPLRYTAENSLLGISSSQYHLRH